MRRSLDPRLGPVGNHIVAPIDHQLFGGNGIMGAGRRLARELGQPQGSVDAQGESFRSPLNETSFDSFGATLIDTDTTVELATLEITAGTARRWGYGSAESPENQGRAYGILTNGDDETIHGELTLLWRNATGRGNRVHEELDTRDMNTTNRHDRENQLPVPERTNKPRADAFEELVIEFEPITPASDITNTYDIVEANSELRLPTTEYDLASNTKR